MSDIVSPLPTAWLTYHQVSERLGLRTAGAAAARARRAKWPKRTRNDTLEVEVCVPAEVLAAGPSKPRERRHPPNGAGASAQATADAVAAAVAPLQSIIESLSDELSATRDDNDALRDQLTTARTEAAEFKGRSTANEAALGHALAERRDLQQRVDHIRREYQAIQERIVLAQAETLDERRRRHATEDVMARLKHELNELQQAAERRRWWQWR
jgi:chromosome segregation ATPase